MRTKFVSLFIVAALLIIYGMISVVATICPNEPAFVFCSTVFVRYVDLVIYIYDLSEQFRLVWPWQR